ncbi:MULTISPECIES: peptidoglycan-binding domain-containing protein [unclassified Sporosarcina]|uniref:peptidoglycan-binding domain-containing protein n=1 Tax=unclassified Sporosarcina TaxID=2647733 RepID=UPI001647822A|nr:MULTISPECIES: peptidoglycan-binding domain-containing protein [unclassified Sporosarcina]MBO0589613.1 peptidoglycan-binding protein [Sporosarcina sp. E16_8]MBO0603522.1 peptidoglycan-binding protein [Sporosarcina sp. E16_3]
MMKRKVEIFIISLLLFTLVFTSSSVNQVKAASYDWRNLGTFPVIGSGYTTSGGFVEAMQSTLWSSGYSSAVGTIDGYYGTGTANGIKSFQSGNGLASDGVAGAATWRKMETYTFNVDTWTRKYSNPGSSVYVTEFKMYSTGAGAGYFSGLISKTNNSVIRQNSTMWLD